MLLNKGLHQRVDRYVFYLRPNLTANVTKGMEDLVFLTSAGNRLCNLAKRAETIGNALGFNVFSPSEVRRVVATHAANTLEPREQEVVRKQMKHSKTVQEKHYACVQSRQQAAAAHALLHPSTSAEATPTSRSPMPKQRRRTFTDEETNAIELFFQLEIEQQIPTNPEKCREFLKLHPHVKRDAKQVQDKVRNLLY